MDANNQYLKELMERADLAFKQLMENPGSESLNQQYQQAKQQLDDYFADRRKSMGDDIAEAER